MRLGPLLALLVAVPLQAAELKPDSKIARVTVFPDGALVARIAAIELPSGPHAILFRGLPASLDPQSLRIEGEGDVPLAIGSVDVKAVPAEARPAVDPALEARIRDMREAREALRAQQDALGRKKAMIERYAQASPEKLGEDGAPLAVDNWSKAWEAVGGALAGVNEDIRKAILRATQLDAEIRALEAARPLPPAPGRPRYDVAVAVETATAFKGTVTLRYRVNGAGWQAAYDARLATGSATVPPTLELVRRAIVRQASGEDWTDVELSASTARTAGGAAAPTLNPLQVKFLELPPPPIAFERARPAPARAAPGAATLAAPPPAPAPINAPAAKPKVSADEKEADIEATAFEATFRIPGRVTVPSDNSQKTFRIGSRSTPVKLSVKAVPAVDKNAYLVVTADNADEAALIAGTVTLTRDGNFIGTSDLPFVAPGGELKFGFGVDERIKVTRVPVSRRETDPSAPGSTKTDTSDFRITVENLHQQPVTVSVEDRVPFSEIATLTVEQLATTTPPTDKAVDSKRGVLGWTYTLKPKEKKDIRVTFRLRYPAERVLVYQQRP